MQTDLSTFIEHARSKGMDHSTIRMLLLSAGWKEKEISQALTEQTLEMSVPLPPDTGGARDAFFHLLTFTAFYSVVISLSVLLFTYINRFFPDAALASYGYSDDLSSVRWFVAAIIVAYPLYALLSRFLQKDMQEHPEKSASGIRRWLTYLTLFVAASALTGDVITLVFFLLEGELSVRFILKVLVVLLLAGGSFWYYFSSLKIHPGTAAFARLHRVFFWSTLAIVLATLLWGVWLAGSPLSERMRKFDERKVEDLQTILQEVRNIAVDTRDVEWVLSKPIPQSLQQVQEEAQYTRPDIVDPQTGEAYGYEVLGQSTVRLCATFNAPRDQEYDVRWNHEAGVQCFEFDVLSPTY